MVQSYFKAAFEAVILTGISRAELKAELGYKRKVRIEHLVKILKYNVSPRYLLTGEGDIFGGDIEEILRTVKGIRNLSEQALYPLIDGFIEIKISENLEPIKRVGKN